MPTLEKPRGRMWTMLLVILLNLVIFACYEVYMSKTHSAAAHVNKYVHSWKGWDRINPKNILAASPLSDFLWSEQGLKPNSSLAENRTEPNFIVSEYGTGANSSVSEWKMAPHLLPLEVRHKLYDSGGDLNHLKRVQSMQTDYPINILLWNNMWYLEESPSFDNCPVKNCILHRNKGLVGSSDAVLFFMPTMQNPKAFTKGFPSPRINNQKWIYLGIESPAYYTSNFYHAPNVIATYRYSSDIVIPYAAIIPRTEDPGSLDGINFASGKTGMAVWAASNCDAQSKRLAYVKRLQEYIPVAVYGKCGQYECAREEYGACLNFFNQTYKFYLAFENSICDDYVTEKLFNILRYNMVPIVIGGANYAQILPPKSYIDIKNFYSPKVLVDYLKYLDQNDSEYNKYFLWKRYYTVGYPQNSNNAYMCGLCHGLHRLRNSSVQHADFNSWWKNSCRSPADHYGGFVSKWY